MNEISERERLLIARGDVAILALETIGKVLRPTLEANQVTVQQLQAILQRLPPEQKDGLFSAITDVATNTSQALTGTVQLVDKVMVEVNAFAESADIAPLLTDATGNVIEALRQRSEVYKSKTDDEMKQLLGL